MRLGGFRRACLLRQFSLAPIAAVALYAITQSAASASESSLDSRLFEQTAIAMDNVNEDLLKRGESVQREIAEGEEHTYRITLKADQYIRVTLEDSGANLAVSLNSSAGDLLTQVVEVSSGAISRSFRAVTALGGAYILRINAVNRRFTGGRYRVRVDELRDALPNDHMRIAASKLFLEATRLRPDAFKESQKKAIDLLEESLALWQRIGDQRGEALSLYYLGIAYSTLREWRTSLQYYERALGLWRHVNDAYGEVLTLRGMGAAHVVAEDRKGAIAYYERALERAKGNQTAEIQTLNDIGWVYNTSGESRKAIDYFLLALALAREGKDLNRQASALNNIGLAYNEEEDYQKALDYLVESARLRKQLSNVRAEMVAQANLGAVYARMGEWRRSIECFNHALPIARSSGDRRSEANILNRISMSYLQLGEDTKAYDYAERALILSRDTTDLMLKSLTFNNAGLAALKVGKKQEGLNYLTEALQWCEQSKDRQCAAVLLKNIGIGCHMSKEYDKALEHLFQGNLLSRQIGYRSCEADALLRIARVERDMGRLDSARSRLESAIGLTESLRETLSTNDLRGSYFASVHSYYEDHVALLMRMHQQQPELGYQNIALQASERARARILLETLSRSGAAIEKHIEPALLQRKQQILRDLNSRTERRLRPLASQELVDESIKRLDEEIDALTIDYQALEAKIRHSNPEYAALTQPQPLLAEEIQKHVLDDHTILLEYFLGDEASYLWVVSRSAVNSFELPRREQIETLARNVYSLLTARNEQRDFEDRIRKQSRITNSDLEYVRAAAELSDMILGPASSLLKGKRRLLVISNGALQYIPFSALPMPKPPLRQSGPSRNADSRPPLIAYHEIVSAPSASTIAILRRSYGARTPASKAIAVLADPVFDRSDPRVKPGTAKERQAGPPVLRNIVLRSAEQSGALAEGGTLARLPFSKQEASAILSLVPPHKRKGALGFDASRSTAMSGELSQYRFIHFSTHSFLNSVHPDLSGIVLSLVEPDGRDQDGFLRAYEVFNLDLPAEMVVLSACSTGLGADVRGEGIVGLTRAFMYAGAARVLVSLWDVDDRATAELMARMYKGIFGPKRLRPVAALRAAQLQMWKEQRWRAPYYWAAFTIQGEWK